MREQLGPLTISLLASMDVTTYFILTIREIKVISGCVM